MNRKHVKVIFEMGIFGSVFNIFDGVIFEVAVLVGLVIVMLMGLFFVEALVEFQDEWIIIFKVSIFLIRFILIFG